MIKARLSKDLNLKYRKMFRGLREIINSWDPYRLIEDGAPEDEFDAEVAKVLSGLSKCASPDQTAKLIAEVFGASFENKDFSIEGCKPVGEQVYSWYQNINRNAA